MSSSPRPVEVTECPACGAVMKVPAHGEDRPLQCPSCGERFRALLPEDLLEEAAERAPEETPVPDAPAPGSLPVQRNIASESFRLRTSREEWERRTTDTPKDPAFQGPLARIEEMPRVEHVRRRRRGSARSAPAEDEPAAPPTSESRRPSRRKRRRRRIRRLMTAVSILGALAALMVIGWALKTSLTPPQLPARAAPTGRTSPEVPAHSAAPLGAAEIGNVSDEDAAAFHRLAGEYFAAESVADLLTLVRDPDRVRPLMERHHATSPLQPAPVKSLPERGDLLAFDNLILGNVTLEDQRSVILPVEKSAQGYRVDWEAAVGWSEVPWERIPEVKPTAPILVRARIKADDYYNRQFADFEHWACYRLSNLADEQPIYGYVPRSSPVFVRLEAATQTSPMVLATLKIRYPSKSSPGNQVLITDHVADGWVVR